MMLQPPPGISIYSPSSPDLTRRFEPDCGRSSAFEGEDEKVRCEIAYTSFNGQEKYTQTVIGAETGGSDWVATTTRTFDSSGRETVRHTPVQRGVAGPVFSYTYDPLNRILDTRADGQLFARAGYFGSRQAPDRMEYFSRASQAKPVFEKSVEYEGAGCEGCGGFGGERIKRIEYSVPGGRRHGTELPLTCRSPGRRE